MSPGKKQKIAVVGAGPAGLAFATTAAKRGHDVTLFDKDSKIGNNKKMDTCSQEQDDVLIHIFFVLLSLSHVLFVTTISSPSILNLLTTLGGQFNMAKLIPGKEEFYETLRYFKKQLTLTGSE